MLPTLPTICKLISNIWFLKSLLHLIKKKNTLDFQRSFSQCINRDRVSEERKNCNQFRGVIHAPLGQKQPCFCIGSRGKTNNLKNETNHCSNSFVVSPSSRLQSSFSFLHFLQSRKPHRHHYEPSVIILLCSSSHPNQSDYRPIGSLFPENFLDQSFFLKT